jgi:hypothetical protein
VSLGQAAIVWALVFLIGLTGGAVLRQRVAGGPISTDTTGAIEPTVEAMADPPNDQPVGSPSRASAPGPAASHDTTSTSVAVPATTVPAQFAADTAPDIEWPPAEGVEPVTPSSTTTSTAPSTTTTTTTPPQTTTTMGCDPGPCQDPPGDDTAGGI